MAFQFCTGFDFYTTASQIWDTVSGTPTINTTNARFGGAHSQGCAPGSGNTLQKNLVGNPATVIVGMALKLTSLPSGANLGHIIELIDTGTIQVSIGLNSSGALQFYRNAASANAIGLASSTNFTAGVWHYLEILATINNGAGVVQCQLDGALVINSSSVNNRQSANSSANAFKIGDTGNLSSIVIDDVYCFDGTGGALNAFLGDRRIITIMPNGVGSFAQFTPSGVANNWDAVNEIPANDATDFVADATVNDRDSYAFEDISINGNADFVVPWARISKDDAGAHTVEFSFTDTANDSFSPAIAVPSSYGYVNGGAFTSSPNGAAALSQTVINRSEFGIKIIS